MTPNHWHALRYWLRREMAASHRRELAGQTSPSFGAVERLALTRVQETMSRIVWRQRRPKRQKAA